MVLSANLGFPRIGKNRELKKALESFWKGKISEHELLETASQLKKENWKLQHESGIDLIPSNDFSFYDHVLDMCCTLGCIPSRYEQNGNAVDLDTYFSMARGCQKDGIDVTAMEMTKWFDTNYHFMVPEFEEGQEFKLTSNKIFDEFQEALELGIKTKPVILGPITFLTLGKPKYDNFDFKQTLEKLLPIYSEILSKLSDLGASWVQIDEPILVTDLAPEIKELFEPAYETLANNNPAIKILLATYFDSLRENSDIAFNLAVDGVHLDLCRGPNQANTSKNNSKDILSNALKNIGSKFLSLGLIDGRNIWKNDLRATFTFIDMALNELQPEQLILAPSCSLLHVPVDLASETELDEEIKAWLAFATQKIKEVNVIKQYATKGEKEVSQELEKSDTVQQSRKTSSRINNQDVQNRVKNITEDMKNRKSEFSIRQKSQRPSLNLPAYPTTSIGSFPQTSEIRKARAAFKKGDIDQHAYKEAMKKEIRTVVEYQHEIGMDVLVHGEPERNDMVEYFGEQLHGFAFTKYGWVQSYGSRCVKPPIIYGDISRPEAMTVEWAIYAQSLTEKIMKGMLTGPITILQWSFVRDDQPRSHTSRQIALAIRDEVEDLESAGIKIIQIDEAAIREGLPLRKEDWNAYLENAVEDFRIASCVVEDQTQIHTHMCYSEFNDIIDSIAKMDADVISIETSRSQMKLLDAFVKYKYPNEIGPGVYDIHSPRVPSQKEILDLLEKAEKVLKPEQIWVNPDCGLKTRGWTEVEPALKNMVEAAKIMREKQKSAAA